METEQFGALIIVPGGLIQSGIESVRTRYSMNTLLHHHVLLISIALLYLFYKEKLSSPANAHTHLYPHP